MPNWLKALLPGARPDPLPTERAEQRAWVKARHREWQLAWHDIFDRDEKLIAEGSTRDDPLPDEINRDYRLICEFSRSLPETRRACLALLPLGAELHRRTEAFLSSRPAPMPEAEARAAIPGLAALFEQVGTNEPCEFSISAVADSTTPEGEEILRRSDDITMLLEGSVLAPIPPETLPTEAARDFLDEPLYMAGGNTYAPRDWITAALLTEDESRLYAELFRLWQGGWLVRLHETGLALVHFPL